MVQVAGSREWRPLKEVIAEARVAAKYAAKKQKGETKEKGPPKKRGGRDALPLVPPPPKKEAEPRPPETPAGDEAPSDAGGDEPLGVLPEGFAPRPPAERSSTPEPDPGSAAFPATSAPGPAGAEEFPNAFIDDPHPPGLAEEPATAPPPDDGPFGVAPEEAPDLSGPTAEPPAIPPGDESIRISVPEEPVGIAPEEEPLGVLPDAEPPAFPSPEEPAGLPPDDEPLGVLPDAPPPQAPDPGSKDAASPSPETEGFGGAFIDAAASSGIEDLVEVPDEPPVIAPEVEPPVVFPSEAPAPPSSLEAPGVPAPQDEIPVPPAPPAPDAPPDDRPATAPPSRVKVVVRDPMALSVEARPSERPVAPPDTSPGEPAPVFPSPEDEPLGVLPEEGPPSPEPPPVLEQDVSSLPVIPLKPGDSQPPAAAIEAPPPAPRPRTRPPAPRPVLEEEPVFAEPVKRGPLVEALLAAVAAIGAFISRALSPINRMERGEPVISGDTPPAVGPALQDLRAKASTLAGTVGERVGDLAGKARESLARKDTAEDGPSTQPPLPLIPVPPRPKPADEPAPSPVAAVLQKITTTVRSWMGLLGEWADRLASALPSPSRREKSEPPAGDAADLPQEPSPIPIEPLASSIEPDEPDTGFDDMVPVSLKKPTWRTESPASTPAPREVPEAPAPARESRPPAPPVSKPTPPPKPPPSTTELPSIPLAPRKHQPQEEVGDVYEGPGRGVGEVLHAVWAWTKVLLVLAGVGAVVAFAALNWRTWFPKATELGRQAFIEVDKVARSGEFRKAVDDAAAQLPQLSRETIRQVQDASTSGLLEPVEVFRLATEAAEQGEGTLTPEEAAELQALRRELVAGLSSSDRERLREYQDIRSRREPFPVEDTSALNAYARGARALPPESLARLQALLAKAIDAGLGVPEDSSERPLDQ